MVEHLFGFELQSRLRRARHIRRKKMTPQLRLQARVPMLTLVGRVPLCCNWQPRVVMKRTGCMCKCNFHLRFLRSCFYSFAASALPRVLVSAVSRRPAKAKRGLLHASVRICCKCQVHHFGSKATVAESSWNARRHLYYTCAGDGVLQSQADALGDSC